MKDREHDDDFIQGLKVNGVWKRVEQRSADAACLSPEIGMAFADTVKRSIHVVEEPRGQFGAVLLVPPRRVFEVGLGGRLDDEVPRFRNEWSVTRAADCRLAWARRNRRDTDRGGVCAHPARKIRGSAVDYPPSLLRRSIQFSRNLAALQDELR